MLSLKILKNLASEAFALYLSISNIEYDSSDSMAYIEQLRKLENRCYRRYERRILRYACKDKYLNSLTSKYLLTNPNRNLDLSFLENVNLDVLVSKKIQNLPENGFSTKYRYSCGLSESLRAVPSHSKSLLYSLP